MKNLTCDALQQRTGRTFIQKCLYWANSKKWHNRERQLSQENDFEHAARILEWNDASRMTTIKPWMHSNAATKQQQKNKNENNQTEKYYTHHYTLTFCKHCSAVRWYSTTAPGGIRQPQKYSYIKTKWVST